MKLRTKFFGLPFVVFLSVLTTLASISGAGEYPDRAIDLIVTASPGGAVDTFFRQMQGPLAKELKVQLNIINRPGIAGTSFAANAKGDGYTIVAQDLMSFLMRQITETPPYDVMKDFVPIANCAYEPLVLVARPDLGFNTLKDLITYAKKNPGKLLAGITVGGQNYVNLHILKRAADVDIRYLPLGGGGEILIQLLGGHVDFTFSAHRAVSPHVRANKLRVLAVLSTERLPEFAGAPTVKEEGFPEVNQNMNYCLLGPKGLSAEIIEKLSYAVKAVLTSPEVVATLDRNGYLVAYQSPSQLRERMAADFSQCYDLANREGLIKKQK
jgi:tripartite-type tricarboxylate transporter receptor subunit TctC